MGFRPTVSVHIEGQLADIIVMKNAGLRSIFFEAVFAALKFNDCKDMETYKKLYPASDGDDPEMDQNLENGSDLAVIVDVYEKTIYERTRYKKKEDPVLSEVIDIPRKLDTIDYRKIVSYYGLKFNADTLEELDKGMDILSEWTITGELLNKLIDVGVDHMSGEYKYSMDIIIENKELAEIFVNYVISYISNGVDTTVHCIYPQGITAMYMDVKTNKLFFPEHLVQIPYTIYSMVESCILWSVSNPTPEKMKGIRDALLEKKDLILDSYKFVKWIVNGGLYINRYDITHEENVTIEYPVKKEFIYDHHSDEIIINESKTIARKFRDIDNVVFEDFSNKLKV